MVFRFFLFKIHFISLSVGIFLIVTIVKLGEKGIFFTLFFTPRVPINVEDAVNPLFPY